MCSGTLLTLKMWQKYWNLPITTLSHPPPLQIPEKTESSDRSSGGLQYSPKPSQSFPVSQLLETTSHTELVVHSLTDWLLTAPQVSQVHWRREEAPHPVPVLRGHALLTELLLSHSAGRGRRGSVHCPCCHLWCRSGDVPQVGVLKKPLPHF